MVDEVSPAEEVVIVGEIDGLAPSSDSFPAAGGNKKIYLIY